MTRSKTNQIPCAGVFSNCLLMENDQNMTWKWNFYQIWKKHSNCALFCLFFQQSMIIFIHFQSLPKEMPCTGHFLESKLFSLHFIITKSRRRPPGSVFMHEESRSLRSSSSTDTLGLSHSNLSCVLCDKWPGCFCKISRANLRLPFLSGPSCDSTLIARDCFASAGLLKRCFAGMERVRGHDLRRKKIQE